MGNKEYYPTKQHLTLIRIMMLEIRERINNAVEINDSTVRSLYLNLITENYETIMMYHGEQFTTAIMEMYAEVEVYETSAAVRDAIRNVKELIKITKENEHERN